MEQTNELNKLTIVNTLVFHTLLPNITRSAIIIRKKNEKMEDLKCGGKVEKSVSYQFHLYYCFVFDSQLTLF